MMNINPIKSESPLSARTGAPVMVIADSDFLFGGCMTAYNVKEHNPNWHGGKTVVNGYLHVLSENHHRANYNGYVREHIVSAEKALGKPLPDGVVVHHANGDKTKTKGNLIICQDNTYHKLLHRRMRTFKACGYTDWVKCRECKKYDDPNIMTVHTRKKYSTVYIHKKCNSIRMKRWQTKNPDYWRQFYKYKNKGGD